MTTASNLNTQNESQARRFPITLYHVSIAILLIAIGVSGYLSYLKLDSTQVPMCIEGGRFDCGTVLNSHYSEFVGIPIAYLGLATNLIMLSLLALEKFVPFFKLNAPILVFGVVTFAFAFSVYLVYLQAAVIKAYCPWCLSHEALITLLFIVSIFRLKNAFAANAE